MNVIADTWRGLVRRRLWPLAVLLVAALVAVPLMLAKSPAPTAPVAPPTAKAGAEDATASYVTLAQAPAEGDKAARRRVLGAKKDPFAPAPTPTRKKKKKKAKAAARKPSATATPDATAAPSAPSSGSAPPAPPAPTATPVPRTPDDTIEVNFGTVDAEPTALTIAPLQVLPSEDDPLLSYEGTEDGGKTAVFNITESVTGEGDGKCKPSPKSCETLKLRKGEVEFIDVTDPANPSATVHYQIELVRIYPHGAPTTAAESSK